MKLKSNIRILFRNEGSEWTMLHRHKVDGVHPVLMNRFPDCENFHKIFPGCERDQDNEFQIISINLSKGEPKMSLFTESQGWTTHFHCLLGLVLCTIGAYSVAIGDTKVAGIVGFIALANIFCALGCMRQKLEK